MSRLILFLSTCISSYLNLNSFNVSLMCRQSRTNLGLPFLMYASQRVDTCRLLGISEMHFFETNFCISFVTISGLFLADLLFFCMKIIW